MPAIQPRVLVTDERQRPMQSMDVHAIERATNTIIAKAVTGSDGVATFPPVEEGREVWYRPMGSRSQGRDGYYGHLRVSVLPKADSDTLPPAAFLDTEPETEETIYLVFTTAPKQVEVDEETSNITIQRRDAADVALEDGDLVVYLYSSSPTGIFRFDPPGADPPVEVTQVTISDGNSTVSFTYEDADGGNPVITASTEELS